MGDASFYGLIENDLHDLLLREKRKRQALYVNSILGIEHLCKETEATGNRGGLWPED